MRNIRSISKKNSIPFIFISLGTLITLLFLLNAGKANASQDATLTFNWQANSAAEGVEGYRLYYGSKSRYNNNGSLKKDFDYDYFVDFNDGLECSGTNFSSCRTLKNDELNCKNLSKASPSCILTKVDPECYFSLTAYNYHSESGYTQELKGKSQQLAAQSSILQLINHIIVN